MLSRLLDRFAIPRQRAHLLLPPAVWHNLLPEIDEIAAVHIVHRGGPLDDSLYDYVKTKRIHVARRFTADVANNDAIVFTTPFTLAQLDRRLGALEIARCRALVCCLSTAGLGTPDREELTATLSRRHPSCAFRIDGARVDEQPLVWIRVTSAAPIAWLFMGRTHTGKTTAAISLASPTVAVAHGDRILSEIAAGCHHASEALRAGARFGLEVAHWGRATDRIFEEKLAAELLALCTAGVGPGRSLVLDMWIEAQHRAEAIGFFRKCGYRVIVCDTETALSGP